MENGKENICRLRQFPEKLTYPITRSQNCKRSLKTHQELNQTMDYIQEQNKNIKTLPLINKKRRKSSFFFYDGPTQPQLTKQDTLASFNNNEDSRSLMNTQRSFYKRRNTIAQARTPGEKQSINDNKEVSFLKRKFSRNTSKISISSTFDSSIQRSQTSLLFQNKMENLMRICSYLNL
eukprot:403353986